MASPESNELANLYRDWSRRIAADPTMAIDQFRALFEEWQTVTSEPQNMVFEEAMIGATPILWARPVSARAERLLLCLHGGGFVTGSPASHRKMFGHIAEKCQATALIVDYRRAPESPFPGPLEDATTCYEQMIADGIPTTQIAFVGDSAGGGLCVSAAIAARQKGLAPPGALFLMSPWLDLESRGASYDENAGKDLIVNRAIIEGLLPAVLGEHGDVSNPLANPIRADLAGLPPTFIQVGGYECFLDDSRTFVERAKQAGVDVRLEVVDEMQHVFQFLAGTAPEADEAIARAAAWLTERLAG